MQQLTEIRAILRILYGAKINYLQQIKRSVVPGEDILGDDYLQATTVTNSVGVVSPYMVNFRAFSAEIANVLAGIAASSNCLIVKTVHVEPSREPLPQLADLIPAAPPPVQMQIYRPLPDMPFNQFNQNPGFGRGERRRPGPMPQYYPTPTAPMPTGPTGPTGPVTILTETPLFVTIYIDVVKLKEPEAPPAAAPAQGRPSRRAER
jgi:hypothetical protein